MLNHPLIRVDASYNIVLTSNSQSALAQFLILYKQMINKELIGDIKEGLIRRRETIAVAESVTAGLLQSAMASCEQASRFFQGGITVYNLGQKCRHLDIDPIHGMDCNCVSEKVAREMAVNVCKLFTSNWGIGITGYATPVPESDNKLFAYFAISYNGHVKHCEKIDAAVDDPHEVQMWYIEKIVEALANLSDRHDHKSNPQPVLV